MTAIKDASKWLFLAALFLFVAATFQIADGHWFPGTVFFGAAAVFMSIAASRQKKKADES